MSVSILETRDAPLPATPGARRKATARLAGLPKDTKHFGKVLEQAMKSNHSHRETKSPSQGAGEATGKPQHHRKSGHSSTSPQTPAIPAIVADSVSNPPSEAHDKSSDKVPVSEADSRRPPRSTQVLELLSVRQFQPGAAAAQDAKVNALSPASAKVGLQLPDHAEKNAFSPLIDGRALARESQIAALVTLASGQEVTSLAAKPLLVPESGEVRNAANVLNGNHPATGETSDRAESRNLIRQAGNAPARTAETTKSQLPQQISTGNVRLHLPDQHLEKAMKEMANLQFNFSSATVKQAEAPPSAGPQPAKVPTAHKSDARLSPDSAAGVRQRQAAVNLQNPPNDNGTTNSNAARGSELPLQPTMAPAGSSSDFPKDGKPGQDSSSRHPEASGLSNPASAASGNFSSVAAAAASSNSLGGAPTPVAMATGAPASGTPLPQSAAAHAAAPGTLPASVETSQNSMEGVINSASMLQSQGKTEVRVALHTDHLGPLELHAVIDKGRLGASIAVVNHDAHTILTNNLPALQQALTDQNLRLDHLSVLNTPVSTGTNTGTGGGFHSGAHAQQRTSTPRWISSRHVQTTSGNNESSTTEGLQGRLSVHA